MGIGDFVKGQLIKNAKGLNPHKKIPGSGGVTLYQAGLSFFEMVLLLNARKRGRLDGDRASLLLAVLNRFCEYEMFLEMPRAVARDVLLDMDVDYDSMDRTYLMRETENQAVMLREHFPIPARKQMVAHLALFIRLDPLASSHADRRDRAARENRSRSIPRCRNAG